MFDHVKTIVCDYPPRLKNASAWPVNVTLVANERQSPYNIERAVYMNDAQR